MNGTFTIGQPCQISKNQAIREMSEITKPANVVCKHCQHRRQTKVEFKTKEYSTTKSLEVVHIDLCGAMRTKGLEGELYFMLIIDDYIRMKWVFFLKKKSETFECFRIFKEIVKMKLI